MVERWVAHGRAPIGRSVRPCVLVRMRRRGCDTRLVVVEDELRTMIDGRAGRGASMRVISTRARPWRSEPTK